MKTDTFENAAESGSEIFVNLTLWYQCWWSKNSRLFSIKGFHDRRTESMSKMVLTSSCRIGVNAARAVAVSLVIGKEAPTKLFQTALGKCSLYWYLCFLSVPWTWIRWNLKIIFFCLTFLGNLLWSICHGGMNFILNLLFIINYLVLHAFCCVERKWRLKETTCVQVSASLIGCCYFFLPVIGYAIQSWEMSPVLFLDWMASFLAMCNIINFLVNIIFRAYRTVLFSCWARFNLWIAIASY